MRQYELRWVQLAEPVGRRPVLLLTRSSAYQYLHHVLIAEITTQVRGIPQEVLVGRREGLKRRSVANLDHVRLVPLSTLGERIGRLASAREIEVKRALGSALDWDELRSL